MEIKCCLCCEGTRLILEDTPGEDEDSSFKCCNGIVHVKTAALFAGISALVLSLFSTVCLFLGVYTVNWWLDIVLIFVNTIVSIILIYGLYIDSPPLLIPFIVAEIAQCAGFFMLACYVFWFTVSFNQDKFRKFDQVIMVVSIIVGIFIAGSAVWAAAKAYHYIVNKKTRLLSLPSSFSIPTISTSLASSTYLHPSSDYPWASGPSYPVSPYRPPTPPKHAQLIPNGTNGTKDIPNGYPSRYPPPIKSTTVSSDRHTVAPRRSIDKPPRPNHSMTASPVLSYHNRPDTVSRSPTVSQPQSPILSEPRLPRVTQPRSPLVSPPRSPTLSYPGSAVFFSRNPTVPQHTRCSTVSRSISPPRSLSPSRLDTVSRPPTESLSRIPTAPEPFSEEYLSSVSRLPTLSDPMTVSTPSFPSRKRVSFSSDMSRSLVQPPSSSRHYFLNDYTRPLPSHSSRSASSLARFPRFIDSVRVEEENHRQSACPSPYSNLQKHSAQSHSNQRF